MQTVVCCVSVTEIKKKKNPFLKTDKICHSTHRNVNFLRDVF